MLKEALSDSNQKVRKTVINALRYGLDISDEHRDEFVPLLVPMLFEPSRQVRYHAAGFLRRDRCAEAVPLEQAARALAEETCGGNIPRLQKLVKKVLKMRQLRGS
jgi:hypothetical protein